jgi:hypothetical protein
MKKILKHLRRNWIRHGFETLVVVVGVLIAFTLNNWNEERKEEIFERKVLNELYISLQRNIEALNRGIDWNEDAIKSCHIILRHFENELSYEDSLDRHFSNSLSWFYPSLDNNAYESLKSYGLHLLTNDTIRDSLGDIYEYKWIERVNTRQEEYFFITVAPILTGLFESNEFGGDRFGAEMKPFDYSELRNSRKYNHILRTLISNRELQIRVYKQALRQRLNLMEMIESELNME